MKVINKILCFMSVLVMCVPLLCFNVAAEDIVDDYVNFDVPYYGSDVFQPDSDGGGSFIPSDNINSDSTLNFFSNNSSGSSSSAIISENGNNYNKFPFYVIGSYSYNFSNPYVRFCHSLATSSKFTFNSTNKFYYFSYSMSFTYSDGSQPVVRSYYGYDYTTEYLYDITVASFSPFYFEETSDGFIDIQSNNNSLYFYVHRSDIYHFSGTAPVSSMFSYSSVNVYSYSTSHPLYFADYDLSKYCYEKSNPFYTQLDYEFTGSYCNFDINSDIFTSNSDKINKGFSSLKPQTLSDQIDVKLTPEFGLDMDRIDPLTNQSDYFKFEITNNSDSAIQWCAGIYDPELVTADTMDILSLSSWAYVCRSTYYDFSVKEDKGIFRTTYTYSGTLKTGSFDYHYLEPGETFSDVIFWENININPNVIYHFFVNAVKTDLKYATLNINPPVTDESSDMHSVTLIEDTYYNTILEGASDFKKLDCNIFNIEFSCLSMPAFTTTVRGGNSVLNTSGNDRYKLYNNYETVSDINGLDTKINKDFTDPSILANTFNRSDVNVDIDSFSVDDVKSYISSCQSFFILIKEALLSFPAFIWALICFGLTGLIVIAVVKALL